MSIKKYCKDCDTRHPLVIACPKKEGEVREELRFIVTQAYDEYLNHKIDKNLSGRDHIVNAILTKFNVYLK